MGYERPYYRDLDYHPFLFYIIFGVKNEELKVSRKRHHVDRFPEGLEFVFYDKETNGAYMESLFEGSLGDILGREDHALLEKVKTTDKWAVIRGEAAQDADLHYMRNTIGFIQALIENGAAGVLDLQTFSLYSPKEWTDRFFGKEWNPCDHVTILSSEMEDGLIWLHTRGMRKFGRPDIGIEKIEADKVKDAACLIDQMICYGSLGAFFDKDIILHTPERKTYLVKPHFVDDPENPDYNNSYYHLMWNECELQENK